MFSSDFSKPRIISIVMLLAILVISLLFSSYSEGMETAVTTGDATTNNATTNNATTSNATTSNGTTNNATTSNGTISNGTTSNGTTSNSIKTVNKDAPKTNAGPLTNASALSPDSVKPSDDIMVGSGKLLSVADITGVLQNNPGVQKMINNKP